MAKDYGTRKGTSTKASTMVVLAGVVIAAGVFAAWQMDTRNKAIAADRAAAATFVLQGAPCAVLTQSAFDALRKGRDGTRFDAEDYSFAMGRGASDCRAFNTKVRDEVGANLVCQFRNPGWVRVTTSTGSTYFDTGLGPATVALNGDAARCVRTTQAAR